MIARLFGGLFLGGMLIPATAPAPTYMISQPMIAGTIILHIVPANEMVAQCGAQASACSNHWFHPPCEIWVPTGPIIEATPGLLSAHFEDPEVADALAHEILHCGAGYWHPTPICSG